MKRMMLLLVILVGVSVLTACKSKNEYLELTELNENQVFTQKESEYYIYFHKDNCSGCQSIITDIQHYNYLTTKNDNLRKIYGINLQKEGETKSFIYRSYTGVSGQGDEGNYYVNTVTLWSDLYIAATPTLIVIKDNGKEKTAHYVTHGASNIRDYIGGLSETDK